MITIKATLIVNENTLKRIYADGCDMDISDVTLDDAFKSEMAWIQEAGIELDDYEIDGELSPEPARRFTGYCDADRRNIYVGDRCEVTLFDLEEEPVRYVADIIFNKNDFFATNVNGADIDSDYLFCVPLCELDTDSEVVIETRRE